MSSQLQILAGTIVDDASTGSVAWSNPDNAKVSDNVYAITLGALFGGGTDSGINIVKSDGTIGSTNKSTGGNQTSTDTYYSYGGASDLWDETWDADKINDVDFGVVYQGYNLNGDDYSHYLKATNFGFTIPSGATINGILVEIEKANHTYGSRPSTTYLEVDHIRITVYYTEAGFGVISPFPCFLPDGRFSMDGSGSCFIAGTKISTPIGWTAIEKLQIGDLILSFNPETREVSKDVVLKTYIRQSKTILMTLENGITIEGTPNHQIYDAKDSLFKRMDSFVVGDEVLFLDKNLQTKKITSMKIKEEIVEVYDIKVHKNYTFFANGIGVHNDNTKP